MTRTRAHKRPSFRVTDPRELVQQFNALEQSFRALVIEHGRLSERVARAATRLDGFEPTEVESFHARIRQLVQSLTDRLALEILRTTIITELRSLLAGQPAGLRLLVIERAVRAVDFSGGWWRSRAHWPLRTWVSHLIETDPKDDQSSSAPESEEESDAEEIVA